jgi:hypothetical protein
MAARVPFDDTPSFKVAQKESKSRNHQDDGKLQDYDLQDIFRQGRIRFPLLFCGIFLNMGFQGSGIHSLHYISFYLALPLFYCFILRFHQGPSVDTEKDTLRSRVSIPVIWHLKKPIDVPPYLPQL